MLQADHTSKSENWQTSVYRFAESMTLRLSYYALVHPVVRMTTIPAYYQFYTLGR